MKTKMSLSVFGNATGLFLAISFVLCVGFDLLFPSYSMAKSWKGLLPGFSSLSPGSFFLGLVESYGWGWYIALVWVPLYNFFVARSVKASGVSDAQG